MQDYNYNVQVRELCDWGIVRSKEVSQGSHHCEGSYATQGEIVQVSQKVTIKVTIHDLTVEMRLNGAGDRHLRWNLWIRSLKICCQSRINEPCMGGTV